jgi:hypothetical protein
METLPKEFVEPFLILLTLLEDQRLHHPLRFDDLAHVCLLGLDNVEFRAKTLD